MLISAYVCPLCHNEYRLRADVPPAEERVVQIALYNERPCMSTGAWSNSLCCNKWRCYLPLLRELLEKNFPRDPAGFQDTWISQGIPHFRPRSLGTHNAPLAHDRQVLADFRLALSCHFNQLLHCSWPLPEQRKEFQPGRFSERLAQLCLQPIQLLFSLAFHLLPSFTLRNYIHIFDFMHSIR